MSRHQSTPMTRLVENLNVHHKLQDVTPSRVARSTLPATPHCDCKQGNKAAGMYRKEFDRRTCDDDAWRMIPVEVTAEGLCLHCNYVPFYLEVS